MGDFLRRSCRTYDGLSLSPAGLAAGRHEAARRVRPGSFVAVARASRE